MSTKVPATPFPTPYPGVPSSGGSFFPQHQYFSPFGGHATLGVGLTSYWPMDEDSGNRSDRIGSNTLMDNNTVTSAIGGQPSNLPSRYAHFTAANQEYFSLPESVSFGESGVGVSFSFWLRMTANPASNGWIFGRTSTVDAERGTQMFTEPNVLTCYAIAYAGTSTGFTGLPAAMGLSLNVWSHVAWIYTTSTKKVTVYVDNVLKFTSSAASANAISNSPAAFQIGSYSGVGSLNADMTSFGVWEKSLSTQEVADLRGGGNGLAF